MALISGMAAGLGVGTGQAFAANGYDVLGMSRSEAAAERATRAVTEAGGIYRHVACDITQSSQVADALAPYAERITVAVHNAHALMIKPFLETTAAEFEHVWRVVCMGAVNMAQAVLPAMLARGAGTLVFTGATASVRGGANFAAFASAKFALRALAQSLAREAGPKGVHVAHVVIDGAIDAPQTTARFGATQTSRLDPAAIGRAYVALAAQERSAWTHELDLRPFSERF